MVELTKFDFIQYTPEELENINLLADFIELCHAKLLDISEALKEITAAIDKAESKETLNECKARLAELEQENKTQFDKLKEATAEQQAIYEAAKQRYFNSLETEQDILTDAQKVLNAVSKEDYESYNHYVTRLKDFTEQSLEIIKQAGGADKITDEDRQAIERLKTTTEKRANYTGFKMFLIMCCTTQIEAYKAKGFEPTALYELINARAAADYTPTPEEIENSQADTLSAGLTEQQEFDIIRTQRPTKYLSINDAASNALFNPSRQITALEKFGEQSNGQLFFTGLAVYTGKKGKQEVNALLSVWYEDENITLTQNGKPAVINDYDRAVFNAICTLYSNGTTAFTLNMLYCAITGKEIHEIVLTDKTKGELLRALNKLKRTEIELNFENEAGQYTFTDAEGNTLTLHRFKETIINLAEADVVINGQAVHAYVINSKPKLLIYAENKKQVLPAPYKALELKIGEKNTPERIALRQFLIDEIGRISKGSAEQCNHITHEAIYNRVQYVKGCSELTKKQKASIRESAIMILDNFVAANMIKAYKEVKQGKSYHHIEITPAEPETSAE